MARKSEDYVEATRVRAHLFRCGRKLKDLRDTHHRYYNGSACYSRDENPVQGRVDGRIVVDAACFQKMSTNYFRQMVICPDHGFGISVFLKLSWVAHPLTRPSIKHLLTMFRVRYRLNWQVKRLLTNPKVAILRRTGSLHIIITR